VSAAASFDQGFRSTAASLRPLSDAEAAALKPMRIRIVTVGAGDSVASLASRLPFEDYREERFRALNGLGPNEQLVPGQRVKLVVE
jgi:predicted Zn-dependent protease